MPNYLSFGCIVSFLLAFSSLLDPDPGDKLNADPKTLISRLILSLKPIVQYETANPGGSNIGTV
jgi:hypothetical protein